MPGQPVKFGVNLNNREPLIAPDYTLADLLTLAERAEDLGFDSVWVGDSLFSKPRWEPINLLSAISQRTSRVKLGAACMVSGTRHPLYLALEWATLDQLSGGRAILGTGMGNPEEGVRREYAAVGLDFEERWKRLDEAVPALRALFERDRSYRGRFYSTESIELLPAPARANRAARRAPAALRGTGTIARRNGNARRPSWRVDATSRRATSGCARR